MIAANEARKIADESFKTYGRIFDELDRQIRNAARHGEYNTYFFKEMFYSSDKIFNRAVEVLKQAGYTVSSLDGQRYTVSWEA